MAFISVDSLIGPYSDFQQAYLRAVRADCAPLPDDAAPAGAGGRRDPERRPAAAGRRHDRAAPDPRPAQPATLPRRARRDAPSRPRRSGGTVLTFRASEAGTLTIAVERARKRRRFKRAGTLTRRIAAGAGRIRLSGRIGRRRLAKGRYRLTLIATDATGNRSRPVRLRFTILKG